MPMTYSIDQAAGLIHIKGEGRVTNDEMLACVDSMRQDPHLEPGFHTLSDMRNIEVGFSRLGISKMMKLMSETRSRRANAKAAIVTSTSEAGEMAIFFEIRTNVDQVDPEFRVFHDIDEARAWLGLA